MHFLRTFFVSLVSFILALAATLVGGSPPALAAEIAKVMVVLDASGSMWGQVDGRSKMDIARDAIRTLLKDWDPSIQLGVSAYGHRTKGDCGDIETLRAIGPVDAGAIMSSIDAINPKGKTPLSEAVRRAAEELKYTEEQATVILVSDGIETCGQNSCELGTALEKNGVGFTAHVIGFDIKEEEQASLRCLAENTGGEFFAAANAAGLNDALEATVVKVKEVAQATPPPATPKPKQAGYFFLDEFDGDSLSDNWEVLNEDPSSYIVEDGQLLIIGSSDANLKQGNVPNIIRLKADLPKGDWVATMKFTVPYQTGREAPFMAIYEDGDNQIVATTNSWSYYNGIRGARVYLSGWQRTGGKETSFNKVIWGGASGKAYAADEAPNPILLRITKEGRSYTPAYKLEGMNQSSWAEHESVTVLRPKGRLAIGIYQAEKVEGETPISIDWFKIEALN